MDKSNPDHLVVELDLDGPLNLSFEPTSSASAGSAPDGADAPPPDEAGEEPPSASERHITARTLRLEATETLEVRCGPARITLHRDGHIDVRGISLSSHTQGLQRLSGATVKLN